MSEEFTCAVCEGVFNKGRSEEEALAEKDRLWGELPVEECDLVCDDCFKLMGLGS